ncbi:RdgB/HAM1 family non-canonical purine NTP pyrophosphatase [Ignatzschineria cameli]|uniref:dITP/XTP pyrophosphatase n=1 Tax=Ignatzschineria cameli TaxID=2182793 RepID=A0A2U2APR6_9GAMM|nr:RdgB/HAM1 family non-canonical purine NTP pyrophosphatase [Ignatzschineria cameli]PWD83396.1 non-canonical purine NTP pyrophosphatase, RdgB/HAM1 family [Ignatzschineria cameli]PWD85514.1 non-canonical purine NTP pyrophosphatase, RdgB/HAM1 family [Ignatzschineria cameli]PWD89172.1 non-canonical purine NTP pyrophosphatase, RdgB/HAM1 family [Ignatzschineria cameli]PWD90654.1 non-canonical purine NTP pyrophosphatase, RdgB/HAM1 family [Ignatzschineria cameli]PWD91358.1 non-canonical purine NTP p
MGQPLQKILIASNNQGKIKEFKALFAPLEIEVLSLQDLNIDSEPEENGLTFIENALIKARDAAKKSGLPTLADDSGLVVPALNGEPGIYSARYSESGNDHDNNLKLLTKMRHLSGVERAAYFKAVLVLLRSADDPVPLIAEGEVHGFITEKIEGNEGFGYDPLFFYPEKKSTFGLLPATLKNQISHRNNALQQLLKKILSL